jgi:hypothetical protein
MRVLSVSDIDQFGLEKYHFSIWYTCAVWGTSVLPREVVTLDVMHVFSVSDIHLSGVEKYQLLWCMCAVWVTIINMAQTSGNSFAWQIKNFTLNYFLLKCKFASYKILVIKALFDSLCKSAILQTWQL